MEVTGVGLARECCSSGDDVEALSVDFRDFCAFRSRR
jgi:hypothetical protein